MRTDCTVTTQRLVESPSVAARLPDQPWWQRLTLGALSAVTSVVLLGGLALPMSALVLLSSAAHAAETAPAVGQATLAVKVEGGGAPAALGPVGRPGAAPDTGAAWGPIYRTVTR